MYQVDHFYPSYIVEHNKKYDYYLFRCVFKIVFVQYEYCPYIKPKLVDDKAMCSRQNFLENEIKDHNNKRYTFSHMAAIHIITIANKNDMSYDFYIKQYMDAVEWKLNATINKNPNLINKLNRAKRHPLIKKFSHVLVTNI